MEELLELKQLLLKGDIKGSLAVVEELEEMSRDDKINNIISYAIIRLFGIKYAKLLLSEGTGNGEQVWDFFFTNQYI